MQSWRTTNRWIVLLRICVLLCGGLSALHFDQRLTYAIETTPDSRGPKYSIAEIRAKLREQLTSIHSIWCEYKVQWSADYKRDKPETWPTFVWAQDNSRVLHRMLPHQPISLDGRWFEDFESFDGQAGYRVLFQRAGKSLPQQIQRTTAAPATLSNNIVPAHHLGLVISGTTLNLLALIERPNLNAVAGPPIDGHQTIQIDFGRYIGENHLIVFFDPQFDFLPRRIASLPARALSDLSQKSTTRNYEGQAGDAIWQIGVESFMEVNDATLKTTRWFPQRLLHSNQMTAFVEKVRVNDEIPLSAFRPNFADGVTLINGPGTSQSRLASDSASESNQSGQQVAQSQQDHSEDILTAELPSHVSWFSVLVIFVFCAVTLTLVVVKYRS